jgi:hypothetical protein
VLQSYPDSSWRETSEPVAAFMAKHAITSAAFDEAHGDDWSVVFYEPDQGLLVHVTTRADGEVFDLRVGSTRERGITARRLRDIPFGELADVARRRPAVTIDQSVRLTTLHDVWSSLSVRMERERTRRPGRRGRPDRYYAEIALAYESWVGTGQSLSVLAAELGDLPVPTLRTALQIARTRGFLTKAPGKGQKGGRVTDKARQLLKEDGDGEH